MRLNLEKLSVSSSLFPEMKNRKGDDIQQILYNYLSFLLHGHADTDVRNIVWESVGFYVWAFLELRIRNRIQPYTFKCCFDAWD